MTATTHDTDRMVYNMDVMLGIPPDNWKFNFSDIEYFFDANDYLRAGGDTPIRVVKANVAFWNGTINLTVSRHMGYMSVETDADR